MKYRLSQSNILVFNFNQLIKCTSFVCGTGPLQKRPCDIVVYHSVSSFAFIIISTNDNFSINLSTEKLESIQMGTLHLEV